MAPQHTKRKNSLTNHLHRIQRGRRYAYKWYPSETTLVVGSKSIAHVVCRCGRCGVVATELWWQRRRRRWLRHRGGGRRRMRWRDNNGGCRVDQAADEHVFFTVKGVLRHNGSEAGGGEVRDVAATRNVGGSEGAEGKRAGRVAAGKDVVAGTRAIKVVPLVGHVKDVAIDG